MIEWEAAQEELNIDEAEPKRTTMFEKPPHFVRSQNKINKMTNSRSAQDTRCSLTSSISKKCTKSPTLASRDSRMKLTVVSSVKKIISTRASASWPTIQEESTKAIGRSTIEVVNFERYKNVNTYKGKFLNNKPHR